MYEVSFLNFREFTEIMQIIGRRSALYPVVLHDPKPLFI